jgi:hypothetical protein
MRNKSFTYAARIDVYTEGKRAFEENRLRSYNPYATSKEFAGLWWHGWDMAQGKIRGKRLPLDKRAL